MLDADARKGCSCLCRWGKGWGGQCEVLTDPAFCPDMCILLCNILKIFLCLRTGSKWGEPLWVCNYPGSFARIVKIKVIMIALGSVPLKSKACNFGRCGAGNSESLPLTKTIPHGILWQQQQQQQQQQQPQTVRGLVVARSYRSFDESNPESLDRELAAELSAIADPGKKDFQRQRKHMELTWKVANVGEP